MAYKIYTSGNLFYINDLTEDILYEGFSKDVLPRRKSVGSDSFSFNNVNQFDKTRLINFTEIDLTGAEYTDLPTFISWLEETLGKSSPQASGNQEEVWRLYFHAGATSSNYTGGDLTFKLPNDGLYQNGFKLSTAFNTVTNQLDLSELEVNSNLEITVDFDVTTTSNNQTVQLKYYGSLGTGNEWVAGVTNEVTYKSTGTHNIVAYVKYPLEFLTDIQNPAEIRLFSEDDVVILPKFLHIVSKKTFNP